MTSSQNVIAAAKSSVSDEELRMLIDLKLGEKDFETDQLRLAAALDLLCEASFEVMSQISDNPSMTKTVEFDGTAKLELSETAIYSDLFSAFSELKVTDEELHALSLRSSAASAIAKAIDAGEARENLAGGALRIIPLRTRQILKLNRKSEGLFQRIFGRFWKSAQA